MYVKEKICSECGGRCCQEMPGSYSPADFNLPGDFLKLNIAIKSGKIAIDWWEGDPREELYDLDQVYYIRPSTKHRVGILFDPSWGGECIFLTSTGCQLKEDDRPLSCRILEPSEDGPCIIHDDITKQDIAIAWLPYQEELMKYVIIKENKNVAKTV